jgi:heme/copper-type cytochrome/quinol oxidase subunit 2
MSQAHLQSTVRLFGASVHNKVKPCNTCRLAVISVKQLIILITLFCNLMLIHIMVWAKTSRFTVSWSCMYRYKVGQQCETCHILVPHPVGWAVIPIIILTFDDSCSVSQVLHTNSIFTWLISWEDLILCAWI